MKNIYKMTVLLLSLLLISACQKEEVYDNPVLNYPISNLVIQVGQYDYIATPVLSDAKLLKDSMVIKVKAPSSQGVVKALNLSDNSYKADVQVGDVLEFIDEVAVIQLTKNGVMEKHYIDMQFTPPPHMFLIRSGIRDKDGIRYYVDEETADRLVSFDYNDIYTGFLDLTDSSWDNIGFVASDFIKYYDYDGGASGVSYYTWQTVEKQQTNGGRNFPCDGPWNNWTFTNGNPDIVSPGFWYAVFNTSTKVAEAFETQWGISGTAIDRTAMTYSKEQKEWSVQTTLAVGTFRFVTMPVVFGDPQLNYGATKDDFSQVGPSGDNISITEAGSYRITLSLTNAPYYTYSITKL